MKFARHELVSATIRAWMAAGVVWTFVAPAHAMGLDFGGGDSSPSTAFVSEVVDTVGRFRSPSRIELFDGKLYIADTQRGHVAVFSTDGVRIGTITEVTAPLGLAMDIVLTEVAPGDTGQKKAKGKKRKPAEPVIQERLRIYVGDRDSGSVTIFEDGEVIGYLGSGAGEFLMPNAIAVSAGRIYVVDSKAGQVRYYNGTGQFEGTFGAPGTEPDRFGFPSDIAIDPLTGEIFVSDWGNRRISVWDRDGLWLRNIAAPLNDDGEAIFLRPAGLGMDDAGNLYVVDNLLSCVVVMSQWGLLVDVFGYQFGQYHTGELNIPVDAASDGNRVYVTSSADGRVQVFQMGP